MAGRPARKARRQAEARRSSTVALESMRSPLLVGRSVANAPAYRGPKNKPSAATVARRASEARLAARPVCPTCFTHKSPSGACCC